MPKVKINQIEWQMPDGLTVLQACEQAGIEIPRFCYHERLSIAGNCRMCLVEVKPGPPKPQASCALPLSEGMEITTDSPMVLAARAGVMEFLLINHPLDCPICDQGGECDLQDQALGYGKVGSRYVEPKRAVADKNLGPYIQTAMTRCIHCTRCVRFVEEVAGVPDIGLLGRGELAEISSLEQAVASELSGNVIDLCPVGALTSKPNRFQMRPWELQKTPSIDVSDGMGCNIMVHNRSNEVFRIVPRLFEEINEEWISDKTRFSYDALKYQRLDKVYQKQGRELKPTHWQEVLTGLATKLQTLKPSEIAVLAGPHTDLEAMFAFQQLFQQLYKKQSDSSGATEQQVFFEHRLYDEKLPAEPLMMTSGFDGVESTDVLLLVGLNPRKEAAVWNGRIRKHYLESGIKALPFQVGVIGGDIAASPMTKNSVEKISGQASAKTVQSGLLPYPYYYLGDGGQAIEDLLKGKGEFAKILQDAKKPELVVGAGALIGKDGYLVLQKLLQLAEQYHLTFNYLTSSASQTGAMLLEFLPPKPSSNSMGQLVEKLEQGKIKLLWLLGADDGVLFAGEQALKKTLLNKQTTIVYQGSFGSKGAALADVILPAPAYLEKIGYYVNAAGYLQSTEKAVFAPELAKPEWQVALALAALLQTPLPFQDHNSLRLQLLETLALKHAPCKIWQEKGNLMSGRVVLPYPPITIKAMADLGHSNFPSVIKNFYQTDAMTQVSPNMARGTAVFVEGRAWQDEGTHKHTNEKMMGEKITGQFDEAKMAM